MFGVGFGEAIIVLLIALIFLGPKKLPEVAKGLGKALRNFQNAASGLNDYLQNDEDTSSKKVTDASQQEVPPSEQEEAKISPPSEVAASHPEDASSKTASIPDKDSNHS